MLWLGATVFARQSLASVPFAITWKVQAQVLHAKKARTLLQASRQIELRQAFSPEICFLNEPSDASKGWRTALSAIVSAFLGAPTGSKMGIVPFDFRAQTGGRRKDAYKFCSHQRCSTNRDHGRDQEVSPARKTASDVSYGADVHRSLIPIPFQQRVFDDRPHVSRSQRSKRQSEAAFRAMDDVSRQTRRRGSPAAGPSASSLATSHSPECGSRLFYQRAIENGTRNSTPCAMS